jgi:hypothetical protein
LGSIDLDADSETSATEWAIVDDLAPTRLVVSVNSLRIGILGRGFNGPVSGRPALGDVQMQLTLWLGVMGTASLKRRPFEIALILSKKPMISTR